ncbi:hypothetical protein [Spiroplasma citri]|uniref:Transmembrane protein n=1 Tax=Spiroplasma citri TaxID=2133 RepID=A0AAJ4EI71_SPICI|nr:hypothetical protein [Spiroplasma citri]APE74117.1 hypothetical protein SCITRI_00203 [Spiroplasma citri]QED24098.1 hypothetical protein FRX96_00885 [Spiroplasma citri]QIA66377.1 hypothetical protein GMI18_00965 [Spiroplasma citri]QIA68254.1 hypothetical protein GL298_01080 [Spiroplasma citri]QIA70129.1 hypothetical protein GL981_01085 [Spiroplasma citri]
MKENKLYAHIVYTLYNIFNDDNIKAQVIVNPDFKKLVIQQICNLLTLEKEFNANLNDNKFTLSFAQVLADITNESEIIEKVDGATFNMLDEEYAAFVQYIVSNFAVEKNYITRENIITSELIDATADFTDEKAIDNAREKLNKVNEDEAAESQFEVGRRPATRIGGIGAPMGGIGPGDFSNPNKFDMSQMMQQMANMPIHPRLDPRFYFYTLKPKYMPILKKIVAGFVILASALLVLLWFLNSYLNIHLETKVIIYTIPGTGLPVIIGGGADSALHNTNNNFSEVFSFGSRYKFLLMQSAGLQIFSGILSILPGIFLGYELLGKKRFKRDNYVVRFWPVVLSIVILLYSSLSLIQVLLPNVVEKYFNSRSVPNGGFLIQNDPQLAITGYLLLPDSDLAMTINSLVSEVYNSTTYQVLRIFTIISMIASLIAGIMVIILAVLAPKTDRNKLIRANTEYQKALTAMMNGQKYEMDPTLFDDEFKDDNVFEKDDSNRSKDK